MASTDIDPELKYCPQCQDEYRADILTCASCNVELITGAEQLARNDKSQQEFDGRSMDLSPDDDLVNLRSGALSDMKRLQNILANERVPALVMGDKDSCGKGCCGKDVFLQIRREDGELALSILAREFIETTSLKSHDLSTVNEVFDTNATQAVCPACGHSFSTSAGTCPDCGLCFA